MGEHWPRVVGRICPMPGRHSDGRLMRDPATGKVVFPGWHGLKPMLGGGFACVRCSATFHWASDGRHVEETAPPPKDQSHG